MSVFTYNDVSLPMPTGVHFVRKALYDESRTDWFVTQFDIRITCMLNISYLRVSTLVGARLQDLSNPAQIMNALWSILMTPRQRLSYIVDGVEMIPLQQGTLEGTVDAMNGPQPQRCNIIQLTPNSFLLDYHIVAHYWMNNKSDGTAANNKGNDVLYNRWTEQVVMDEMMATTRVRQGSFRIRSDNTSHNIPDFLRSELAVLSIPSGFIRQSSQYAVSPDGLTLSYSITDREVFKLPPHPAFKAEGYFMELGTKPGAVYREGIVNIRLYGSPSTSQSDLYFAAWTIAAKKMAANLGAPNANVYQDKNGKDIILGALKIPLLSQVTRKIWLYENIVEIEARAMLNFSKFRVGGAPIGTGSLVFTPGSDDKPKRPPLYKDRGSAALLLNAAAYWDPNALNAQLVPELVLGSNPFTTYMTVNDTKAPQGNNPGTTSNDVPGLTG